MGKWKKTENGRGFIYYINEETNLKQWDHPKFSDVKQAIDDCNYVAFPLYRLALKFRVLQRSLYMEEVPLSIITAIFERHRLGNSESSLTLETCDLEAVLSDIFFASNKKNHSNIDVDYATEIVTNFLYNVFDNFREGNIQVFSTKVILGLLSNCSLLDLYKFLFSLTSDHNNCITRLRLQGLLLKIYEVVKYLHEDASLGLHSINLAIESCFHTSPGLVGVTESNFIGWLETDPPFLAWLSLIAKLKSAETVIHAVKCTTCKTRPLMGIRYRCIKCSRFTQCQRCFLTGRLSNSHKLSHPVREYSGMTSSKSTSEFFLMKICGLFCPMRVDTNFTVVKPVSYFTKENKNPSNQSIDPLCDVEPLSSPQSQLQSVIRHLESQNRELQQLLILGNYSDKEIRKYLEEYRIFMAANITKLKLLKNRINTHTESDVTHYKNPQSRNFPNIQSTPMVQLTRTNKCKNKYLEQNMSPIALKTEIDDHTDRDYETKMEKTAINYVQQGHASWDKFGRSDSGNKGRPVAESNAMEPPKNDMYVTKSPVKLLHNDLDEALARLQQILANNFSLEDSLAPMDNTNLKYAVTEVEGMLTSIIDNVESSRSSSALQGRTKS